MTGHKGNSEVCFPETLNVSRSEAEGNILVEGNQNSLFPAGPVIKCFVIPPKSKLEKTAKKSELESFDPRHVTCSPPIEKRF